MSWTSWLIWLLLCLLIALFIGAFIHVGMGDNNQGDDDDGW